MKKPLTNR